MTSKGIKHLNLRENMVRGCHKSKYVDVEHIPGIINPSERFTKDTKDNTHIINIRGSIMVSLQAFLKYIPKVTSHTVSAEKLLPYHSIRLEHIVPDSLELKLSVPKHIVSNILVIQSGVRQNV